MTLIEFLVAVKEIVLPVVAIGGAVISAIYTAADRKTLFSVKDQLIQNLESENKRLKEWTPAVVEEWALSYKRQYETIIKELKENIARNRVYIKQRDEKIKSLISQKATTEQGMKERDDQINILSKEKNELSQKVRELTEISKVVDKNIFAISTVSDSLGTIVTSGAQVEVLSQGKADIWQKPFNPLPGQLYIRDGDIDIDPEDG
jgi:uncharacterized protein (DUF3084 family)